MLTHLFTQHLRAVSLATVIVLTACNAAAPVVTPTEATLTLTFWHAQTGIAASTLDTLAREFHQANPAITIRGETKPSDTDLMRQGIAAMALNQLPDFILASDRTIAEFARRDALAPLDGWLDDANLGLRENERTDFVPGLLDTARQKNQTIALPFDTRTVVLCYNVNLLTTARMSVPRTWDEFSNAARATTRGNAHGWVMKPDARVFDALILGRGGSTLNDAQTLAQLGDAPGLATLQMIAALERGGAATSVESDALALAEFAQGHAAFVFVPTDQLANLSDALARANATFLFGIAPVPQADPNRAVSVVFGAQLALFKTSPARARAAWQFARWLAQPEQAARWAQSTYAIPVRMSARATLASDPGLTRLRGVWGDPLPTFRPAPTVKDAALIDAAIVEMWTSVATGADISATLSRTATRINRLLGQTP